MYLLEGWSILCKKKKGDAEIYFASFFPVSHSNVLHREFCVKDFSGTTAPRILKFGTNIEYDLLYCVTESALILMLIIPFILSMFSFFLSSFESQTLQILYTPTEG